VPRTPSRATPSAPAATRDLLAFLDASPTPWHAVAETARRLGAAGFRRLDERSDWRLGAGDRVLVDRGGASVVALRLGAEPPAEAGFRIVGAHVDSPGLRVKPRPARVAGGYLSLDVEVYGGAILATWTDRDLGLAGRVVTRGGKRGGASTTLVRVDRPVARIPNLAIHLNRAVNEDGLRLDRHKEISPALASWAGKGSPDDAVLAAVAEAAGVERGAVTGFDLALFDVQRAAVGGLEGEFVFSARLDDLAMSHAAVSALLDAAPSRATAVVALFDGEEIGSETPEGAASAWLRDLLARVEAARPAPGGLPRALAQTLLVSADMAHGVHPNHADRHDGHHAPVLNGGPVVKTNANRRYATDGGTAAFFRGLCAAQGVPCQEFVTRADLACGSTIGPIVAARLGVRAVDVGNAMLSMHSCREAAGTRDPERMTSVLARFLSAEDPLP
jgi:aspartyl aminopeptidase